MCIVKSNDRPCYSGFDARPPAFLVTLSSLPRIFSPIFLSLVFSPPLHFFFFLTQSVLITLERSRLQRTEKRVGNKGSLAPLLALSVPPSTVPRLSLSFHGSASRPPVYACRGLPGSKDKKGGEGRVGGKKEVWISAGWQTITLSMIYEPRGGETRGDAKVTRNDRLATREHILARSSFDEYSDRRSGSPEPLEWRLLSRAR